ncbi:hypothetical protein OK016_19850 [Vibrio chagasii]|nr:hypothetical protein [Vibrio chagasii]
MGSDWANEQTTGFTCTLKTGRTHQLRVHCSHEERAPCTYHVGIKRMATKLTVFTYHAEELALHHNRKKWMEFSSMQSSKGYHQ